MPTSTGEESLMDAILRGEHPANYMTSVGVGGGGSGNEPTVNGQIQRAGGVISPIDGKAYTSRRSYEGHLKQNDCAIVGNDYRSMANKAKEKGEVQLAKGRTVTDREAKNPFSYKKDF